MATTIELPPTLSLSKVLQSATISQVLAALFTLFVGRWIARGIYRVYFHPLSKFPGPKFSSFTRISQVRAIFTGTMHEYIQRLHEQYGDVVRIAPDELSFIDSQAWRDIYGHGTKGTPGSPPPKNWKRFGRSPNGTHSVISCPSDVEHARMRKVFNPAFSDRALKQQEPLFMKYVDQLVQVLGDSIKEDPQHKHDLVRLYNFTTFDVMGDLTFGEPLHMLDNAEYDPWVSIIFKSIKLGSRISLMHHYPWLYSAFKTFVPESVMKKRADHFQHSVDRVTKRLEKGRESEGVDLWDLVLGQKEGKGLSRGQMDSNASLFMIAGTETTATLVSGLTYYLLKNPRSMEKLTNELRNAYSTSADMSIESIAGLPYLNACIKEGLRCYPPVVIGLPHLTPANGSTICGHFVPPGTTVTTQHLATYRSPKNFRDPDVFVPERWTGDERYKDDNRDALQPFSVGTRDCLGKNMAYHEMRLIIAKVFYNFDLKLCPESENWRDQQAYILWEKRPLLVTMKPV